MATNVGSVSIAVTGNTDPLNDSLAASIKAIEQYASALSDSMKDSEKDVAKSTANAGGDVEEFSEGSLGLIEGFAAGFAAAITGFVIEKLVEMGSTFMEVATRGMEFAGEVNTALKTVQAQTGASSEEMVGLKDSMMGVYSSGFVDNMEESAAAISAVSRITGETGDALIETTTDALAFGQAFDKEVTEVMAGARGMMNGFGISAEESMDLAAYAIQKTGDPAGDLLDTLTEYSPLMNQVGLDAEQFTAALIGGLEGGAFNTDQIGDAFKEFGISLMDPINDVATRMSKAMAAGGDEGAQAWLDMQDEIESATEEVDRHKESLDKAKEEWTKTNDKVKEYQGELDKAWADLQKFLNPSMDLSEFTDQIDEIEGRKIEAKLNLLPIEEQYEAAKKALDDQLKGIDDRVKSQREKIKAQQEKLRKAESEEEKKAIQANIDKLNEELTALNDSKDALRDSSDNSAAKKAYEAQRDKIKQYDQEIEQQNLLMEQDARRQKQNNEAYIESQGYNIAEIKGLRNEEQQRNDIADAVNRYQEAQQNLNAASDDESVAKQQLDQSQAAYDQAVNYLENIKAEFGDMPNPGQAMAENFKKGGPEAQQAMKDLAASLLEARKTMSDVDFKGLLRDIGFGTLAEEMKGTVFDNVFAAILNPGDIANKAAGTVDEIKKAMDKRWEALGANWSRVFEPLGQQLQIIKSRVLPILERIVEYFGLRIAPALEIVGKKLDEVANKVFPKIETFIMGLLVERLGPWLDWFATWLSNNGAAWGDWLVGLADKALWLWDNLSLIGGLLVGGGLIGGALTTLIPMATALWATLAPMFAMITGGTLTASLTAFGATLTATFATITAPLTLAVASVMAFALAWSTNFGGVRDITFSVMTAISTFIADRLAFMVAWWTKYGADVMVVVNGLLTVVQTIFGAILLFITTAAEGYRLLWAKFGDDIMAIIGVAVSNAMLILQGFFSIIGELFGIFADLIKGNWSGVWQHFVNIMTIQKDTIMGIWNNILGLFGTSIEEIVKYFADLPGRIAAYFSPEALIQIATDAMQAFSDTITAMMPSLPSPGDFVPDLGGVMNSAQNLVSGTAASISGAIPSPTSNTFNQSLSFPQPGADAETIRRVVRQDTINIVRQATGS